MKTVSFIQHGGAGHWVGDGFPVRSIFSYHETPQLFSPFLLLDYASPTRFDTTTRRRGVGQHPHRGFETVTIVYDGEVSHRDSSGGGGTIGTGGVQWMTAGAGIVHEEFHSERFAREGGPFEMAQLWVNLPARDKGAAPGYQGITAAQIPQVDLRDEQGAGDMAVHSRPGRDVRLEVLEDATVLWLSGEPIDEPVVGYGPFVMNSEAEIHQAYADFQSGRMGRIAATTA